MKSCFFAALSAVLAFSSPLAAEESDLNFNDVILSYWETLFVAHMCEPYIPTGQPFVTEQIAEELKSFGLEDGEVAEIFGSARKRGDDAGIVLQEEDANTPHAVVLYCTEAYQKRLDKLNEIRGIIFE